MKSIIEGLGRLFLKLKLKLVGRDDKKDDREVILKSLKEAEKEWKTKEEYFNHATDPDLVDFAIYDIEASRRKYSYLLKKLKKEKNV